MDRKVQNFNLDILYTSIDASRRAGANKN